MNERALVYGKTGWIGGHVARLLAKENIEYKFAENRMENREAVAMELDEYKPTVVFNAAGKTGRPTVDWCESHKQETVRANVVGTLNLADLCDARGIHLVYFATGCIYDYASVRSPETPFTEEDTPNYIGSFYSKTKSAVDQLMEAYPNSLTLRVRMPFTTEKHHPRSIITKLSKYPKLIDVPNSMTSLDDMLPIALDMAKKRTCGVFNFTNPGVISHTELMELYKKYVDPAKTWEVFSLEEQAKILVAGRCNCALSMDKLSKTYPDIPGIKESMEKTLQEWARQ